MAREREHEDEKQRAEGTKGHEDGQRQSQLGNSCSERPGLARKEVKLEEIETVCNSCSERPGSPRLQAEVMV